MYELLATHRVQAIMQGIRDVRELPQELRLLNRTPMTDATDGEMVAFWEGNVFPADIVADDQRARSVATGKFVVEANKVPNVKQSEPVTQEMLNLLDRIRSGGAIRDDVGVIDNWLRTALERRLIAVRQTQEIMRVGAFLDLLEWNRGGVQFAATFGKPADLKVSVSTAWTVSADATPVSDIQTHIAHRREKYGQDTTRITMTSVDFRRMISTVEFREKATLYSQLVLPSAGNFPIQDISTMRTIAGRILNVDIELYDAKYAFQNLDGTVGSFTNFWPEDFVGFSDAALDNNPMVVDFANGVVTETIVASLTGTSMGTFAGGSAFGPVGYVTPASADLNPPGLNVWGVARCIPRVMNKTAESYLKVASL